MNNIVKIDARSACPDLSTLEDILVELSRFGAPALVRSSRGWWCYMDMFIQGEGIKFEVKSESNHAQPMGAASQCLDRVRTALRDIAKKTP